MKAIVWKELRENAKWGILAAILLGISYTYALSQFLTAEDTSTGIQYGHFVVEEIPTSLLCPIVGALLGLIQIIPELRRDQWAFLVHRPVPTSTIFWGKVCAGCIIYLVANLLPFLCVMIWLSIPERIVAPFDWHFALAGFSDILSGLCCYAGALLTAIRPVRWYTSRVFPLMATIAGPVVLSGATNVSDALLFVIVMAVILTAARWNFLFFGGFRHPSPAGKSATALLLYLGGILCGCAITGILIGFGLILLRGGEPTDTGQYVIDNRGRILLIDSTATVIKEMNPGRSDGKPVHPRQFYLAKNQLLRETKSKPTVSYRSLHHYYSPLNVVKGQRYYWYFDKQRSLVVGYSVWAGLIGYLTPDGFIPTFVARRGYPLKPFDGPLLNGDTWNASRVLAFPNAVYLCDFDNLQVHKVVTAKPGQPFENAIEATSQYWYEYDNPVVVTITQGDVSGYTVGGKNLFTVPREKQLFSTSDNEPVSLNATLSISVLPNRKRFFLWYEPNKMDPSVDPRHSAYLYEIESGSSKVSRLTLPSLYPPKDPTEALVALFGLPFGPAVEALSRSALTFTGPQYLLDFVFVCSIVSGLLSAIAAFLIGRRCAFPKAVQWGWTAAVFLLGPFALLTLLSLRAWPARKPCPSCEKLRVVDRDHCEHCGAAWPEPARDGTEIFEEVQQQAA